MNQQIYNLMLEAGYSAPELAKRAQYLAESLILLCASRVINDEFYYNNILELLKDDTLPS